MWEKADREIIEKIIDILITVRDVKTLPKLSTISIETEQRIFEFEKLKKLSELFKTEDITWRESQIPCECEFNCGVEHVNAIGCRTCNGSYDEQVIIIWNIKN